MSSRSGSPPAGPPSSSGEADWVADVAGGIVLRIHAQPGAARSGVAGRHGDALKIRLRARPVEGEANRELVALLCRALAVRPADVALRAGARGRRKSVHVAGIDAATARVRLAPFVDKAGGAD